MGLIIKIATGIILAAIILLTLQFGFGVLVLKAISDVFSSSESRTPTTTVSAPALTYPAPEYRIAKSRKPRYTTVWIPGRPLSECMGRNKELNENVLRCRNGYEKRVRVN